MSFCKSFQKVGITAFSLAASMLLFNSRCDAFASQQAEQQQSQTQGQSQSQQKTPPQPSRQEPQSTAAPSASPQTNAKGHRVWTNEDLVALRTPADIYLLEKEALEAAEAAAAAAKEAADRDAAANGQEQAPGIKLPQTQEETEKMLKDAQANIQEESLALESLKNELPNTPAEQQAEKQKEIDRVSASLEQLKRDAQTIEDHLKTFGEKPSTENPPAPPSF
jgi:hypothetical protein